MKKLLRIVASLYIVCTMNALYSSATMGVAAKAMKAAIFARPSVVSMQKMMAKNRQTLANGVKSFKECKESVRLSFVQSQELYRAIHAVMSQNPVKIMIGSALTGGMMSGSCFATQVNPYEQKIKDQFVKAVASDDATLVDVLSSISYDQETLEQAALKHALINSKNVKNEKIKEVVNNLAITMEKSGNKLSPEMMQELLEKDINFVVGKYGKILPSPIIQAMVEANKNADQKAKANIKTFALLLDKLEDPNEILENVIKGGDLNKVKLMLKAGVPVGKLLKASIKAKNKELVIELMQVQDSALTRNQAIAQAEYLCDRSLFTKVFWGSKFKNSWFNTPWFKRAGNDYEIPEPVTF